MNRVESKGYGFKSDDILTISSYCRIYNFIRLERMAHNIQPSYFHTRKANNFQEKTLRSHYRVTNIGRKHGRAIFSIYATMWMLLRLYESSSRPAKE